MGRAFGLSAARAAPGEATQRWKHFLAVDALFLVAFAVAAFLRSYVPEIDGTEKPMDFAFVNATLRADSFPPEDPWLAGHGISYYYFGHLITAMAIKLTAVTPAVGYNLGLTLTAALATVVCFGLVWNLLTLAGKGRQAYVFGGIGVVLVLFLANWEGLFELLAVHNLMPGWLYSFLDIDGLDGDKESSSWYPTEFWFWWRASRIVSGWTIREFPFFSFMLGDLHAHVMALPFFVTTLGATLALMQSRMALDWRSWQVAPLATLLLALLTGSLIFLNAWDFPTALVVVALGAAFVNLRSGLSPPQVLLATGTFVASVAAVGLLLFSPFLSSYGSAAKFIAPIMVTPEPDVRC